MENSNRSQLLTSQHLRPRITTNPPHACNQRSLVSIGEAEDTPLCDFLNGEHTALDDVVNSDWHECTLGATRAGQPTEVDEYLDR